MLLYNRFKHFIIPKYGGFNMFVEFGIYYTAFTFMMYLVEEHWHSVQQKSGT